MLTRSLIARSLKKRRLIRQTIAPRVVQQGSSSLILLFCAKRDRIPMGTPKHELTYFDGAGRAEAIRIMLHAAEINFVDKRITYEEWLDLRSTTPTGFLPLLLIENVGTFTQSNALLRYAARMAGFYPSDLIQALVVDEAMDTMNEMFQHVPKGDGLSEDEKKEKRREFQNSTLTRTANFLESRIRQFGNGGVGFGKNLSPADLLLLNTVRTVKIGFIDHIDVDFFESYEGIMATYQAVRDHPKVKAYYEYYEPLPASTGNLDRQ